MPDDDDIWKPAATLSDDGSIEGRHVQPTPPRPKDPFAPSEEPLELDRREPPRPPQGSPPEDEQPKSDRGQLPKAIAAVVVVLLICAVALGFVLRRQPGTTTATPAAPEKLDVPEAVEGAPSLTVQSDPPGATVFIQGEEAGRTPLLGSNEFARGATVTVRVELHGYKTWVGSFSGGTNATLRAKLSRK